MKVESAELAQAHWNETPLYLTEAQRYGTYPWLYGAAEFVLHPGERVLEIGCGTGSDLLQFAKHGAIATGVDITDTHLDLARKRVGDRAEVVKGDFRSLPFPDSCFDYVYSHGVLHHLSEPEQAVKEIFRILKPGGRFNIHVYSLWSMSTLRYVVHHGRNWKLYVENSTRPVHIELYTARRLRRLLGKEISIEKYQCWPFPFLAPALGWFLVAKGKKSSANISTM